MVMRAPEVLGSWTHSWSRIVVLRVSLPGELYQISPNCIRAEAWAGNWMARTRPSTARPAMMILRMRFSPNLMFSALPQGSACRPQTLPLSRLPETHQEYVLHPDVPYVGKKYIRAAKDRRAARKAGALDASRALDPPWRPAHPVRR